MAITASLASSLAGVNMLAVYARNDEARRVVAGFAAATPPTLAGVWQQVDRALADVPALGAVIARLAAELAARHAPAEAPGGDRDDA